MNFSLKLLLVFCFALLCLPIYIHAQRPYEGVVVEKKSGQPVPYASVKLVQENVSVSADEKGMFKLPKQKDVLRDTLVITAVGFRPLKIPVFIAE